MVVFNTYKSFHPKLTIEYLTDDKRVVRLFRENEKRKRGKEKRLTLP
jgi:hypothetical protein